MNVAKAACFGMLLVRQLKQTAMDDGEMLNRRIVESLNRRIVELSNVFRHQHPGDCQPKSGKDPWSNFSLSGFRSVQLCSTSLNCRLLTANPSPQTATTLTGAAHAVRFMLCQTTKYALAAAN